VFTLPSIFQTQTGFTIPLSMSFNSLEISKNQDLVKSIDWINTNTKNNSEVIGTVHWRGWFHLLLEKPRQYTFTETISLSSDYSIIGKNITTLSTLFKNKVDFQCIREVGAHTNISSASGNERNIYLIDLKPGNYSINNYYPIVHNSKYFSIYEITESICG
jgi:hypothetical protein